VIRPLLKVKETIAGQSRVEQGRVDEVEVEKSQMEGP
jgi:hypothetical protein